MLHAKPGNKRTAFAAGYRAAAAALLVAAVLPFDAAAQGPRVNAPLPDAQHYDQCLALTRTNPQRAYDDATAWRNLGGGFPAQHCAAVALVGLKQYPEAATQLQGLANAMMQASPTLRGDALSQAGQAWLLGGRPNEAKAAFDAALAFKPDDPEILIDRAEAYALGGKFFESIDDLNRALDILPSRVDALVYRASAYRQLNSLDLALDDVERALKLEPNAVAGLLERGNIRQLQGNSDGAKADWAQVQKLAPGSPAAQAAKDNIAHLTGDQPGSKLLTGPAKKP
jgi:tetratricopeptide (TPR) repeat protein